MSSRAKRRAAQRTEDELTFNGGRHLRIEYMPLGEIRGADKNPKRHRLDVLEDSYRRFGFVEVPVLDERTGQLVAGHGRIEALSRRKAAGHAAPDGVEDRDGEWWVPVQRGMHFKDHGEAAAYLVASNQTSMLGGWDFPELHELAREIEATASEGLIGTGFTMSDIEAALEREVQGILGAGEVIGESSGSSDASPPNDFTSFDENISTNHTCPKCGYKWSGGK